MFRLSISFRIPFKRQPVYREALPARRILPLDPREQRVLDQLRDRRALLQQLDQQPRQSGS